MRGLEVGKNEMANRLSVEKFMIEDVLRGKVQEELIKSMATELSLDNAKLIQGREKGMVPCPR